MVGFGPNCGVERVDNRATPSGVGPSRLEQPTPTPLQRRGIIFIAPVANRRIMRLLCPSVRPGLGIRDESFLSVKAVQFPLLSRNSLTNVSA